MFGPTLIDLNLVKFRYYPFVISLDKCNENFNVLSICNSNQKWNNETCQCGCNSYCTSRKDYSWNPSTCICENRKYLKSIADASVIAFDEIISAMDIISTKITIATNVSINFDDKKVKYKNDCNILHTVLLVIIFLLKITIICYHYAKHSSKQKGINALTK